MAFVICLGSMVGSCARNIEIFWCLHGKKNRQFCSRKNSMFVNFILYLVLICPHFGCLTVEPSGVLKIFTKSCFKFKNDWPMANLISV